MLSVNYLVEIPVENVLLARNLPTVNVYEKIAIFLTNYHKSLIINLVRG